MGIFDLKQEKMFKKSTNVIEKIQINVKIMLKLIQKQ